MILTKQPVIRGCSSKTQRHEKKKKSTIEQQREVLCPRKEGSVKGKRGVSTACTIRRTGVTIHCVATRCVPSGFSGNSRARSQVRGMYTGKTGVNKPRTMQEKLKRVAF